MAELLSNLPSSIYTSPLIGRDAIDRILNHTVSPNTPVKSFKYSITCLQVQRSGPKALSEKVGHKERHVSSSEAWNLMHPYKKNLSGLVL